MEKELVFFVEICEKQSFVFFLLSEKNLVLFFERKKPEYVSMKKKEKIIPYFLRIRSTSLPAPKNEKLCSFFEERGKNDPFPYFNDKKFISFLENEEKLNNEKFVPFLEEGR